MFYYFELMKVTVADGPVGVSPLPPRIAKKLPIRNSWALISGKLPIPLPMFFFFEFIREVLANTLSLGKIFMASLRK